MKSKNHLAIILIILGSAVLVNQVTQPLSVVQTKTDVEQGEGSKPTDSDEAIYVLQTNLAINSFSQVTPHQELYQIREILLDEVSDPHPVYATQRLTGSDHFKALFRKVISTNAP